MATCDTTMYDDHVWYTWTTTSTTSTTSSTATDYGDNYNYHGGDVWSAWNGSGTSSTSNGDVVWIRWTYDRDVYTQAEVAREAERRARSMARTQREAQEAAAHSAMLRERYAAERREREERTRLLREKKEAAELKAQELLLDMIGEEQLEVYKQTGRLFVKGRKHDYILQKGGFVLQVQKDKVVDLCVHLANRYTFPETDNVVALKLAIEDDEKSVVKLANNHGSRPRNEETVPRAACM